MPFVLKIGSLFMLVAHESVKSKKNGSILVIFEKFNSAIKSDVY